MKYGINTGFGNFKDVIIPPESVEELQVNLIRSHASGVGENLSYERSLRMLALRCNVLAKGNSGVSHESLQRALDFFNAGVVSVIPLKGTVGASGDLAPLAHLCLGLIGEGEAWDPEDLTIKPTEELVKKYNLTPVHLRAKEGLAFINGTQFISTLGAEALVRAEHAALQADIISCMTFEALRGTTAAYCHFIHDARKHAGQREVAERMRAVLNNDLWKSDIFEKLTDKKKVQDSYTLRCAPLVHGITHDTLKFVRGIITTELNSATDNPMIFRDDNGEPVIISGGNFHGEYPAEALDFLAIAIHEISDISERRIERLVNSSLGGLNPFLTVKERGGLDSGFMIAHCCAAALVSENKVLTHPGSVDSISTSAGQEDHVSMGGFCARKALEVTENVENVIAIELLAACQGVWLLNEKPTEPLQKVYELVRENVTPYTRDRFMSPDIKKVHKLVKENKVWEAVAPYIEKYHQYELEHGAK